jgi:hypothetical protein
MAIRPWGIASTRTTDPVVCPRGWASPGEGAATTAAPAPVTASAASPVARLRADCQELIIVSPLAVGPNESRVAHLFLPTGGSPVHAGPGSWPASADGPARAGHCLGGVQVSMAP